MLNIPELERRWFQYKIKSYIPYLSIVISLTIIFGLSTFFYLHEKIAPTPKVEKKVEHVLLSKPIEKNIQPIKVALTQKNTLHSEPIESKQELRPSLNFMQRMQNSVQPYYKSENVQKRIPQQKNKKTKQVLVQKTTPTVIQPTPAKVTIRREDTKNDIKEIIQRFKHNDNPALSLFIAKKSYALGDYKQAYNYALITNRINSDIEASWIVFAKALVKLGKKKMAIQTLKKYISYSNSGDAKILLDNITSGKFR